MVHPNTFRIGDIIQSAHSGADAVVFAGAVEHQAYKYRVILFDPMRYEAEYVCTNLPPSSCYHRVAPYRVPLSRYLSMIRMLQPGPYAYFPRG